MGKLDYSDIPDDRLSGKSPLDCARKVELRILRIFDRICGENGLQYCLAYGTLLGAVRHGGFIPWDDDIDVHMPMEDYKRFVKIASDVLPDEIGFYHGKQTQCGFGKLIDRKSFYLDETNKAVRRDVPQGIFIDIFPIRRYRFGKLHVLTTRIVRYAKLHSLDVGTVTLAGLTLKWFWRFALWSVLYPLDFLNSRGAGHCAAMPQMMWGSAAMLPEYPFPASTAVFEGHSFPAPKNIDKYLRAMYGNYMELPPKEKRFVHAKIIVPMVKSVGESY